LSSGIYEIRNSLNNHIYIGSTKNFCQRWQQHRRLLQKGAHHSRHFANAWFLCGEASFLFAEIEQVNDLRQLIPVEQRYLDEFKPAYNVRTKASRPSESGHDIPVERISPLNGEVVEYRSISEAAQAGFDSSGICDSASGQTASHANYYWRFLDGRSDDLPEFDYERIFYPVRGVRKTDGHVVELSSYDDCNAAGFNYRKIRECCAGQRGRREHKEYSWTYMDVLRQAEEAANPCSTFEETFNKPVERIDKNGEITKYPSISATSEAGFTPSSVGKCCRGERETHRDDNWRFADGSSPQFISKRPEIEISQISIETGECLRVWRRQAELEEAGYSYPTVWGCMVGEVGHKTYKNSIWRRGNVSLSMTEVEAVLDSKYSAFFRGVVRLDPNTGARKEYASQSAVEADGYLQAKVSRCCLGKGRKHAGYYWEFLDGSTPANAKNRIRKIPSVTHTSNGKEIPYTKYADLANGGFDVESVLSICEAGGNQEWRFSDKTRKTTVNTNKRVCLRTNAVQATASDSTTILYASMHEAALGCGGTTAKIRECCMGKRKTHAGFSWSFAEN
jgi:hypothetical protein